MDEQLKALNDATMAEAARLLTLVIGIAAMRHPEELRAAFGTALSIEAAVDAAERAVRIATAAQSEAVEVAYRVREMRDDLMSEIQAVQKDFDEVRQLAEQINRPRFKQWCKRVTERLTAIEAKQRPLIGQT